MGADYGKAYTKHMDNAEKEFRDIRKKHQSAYFKMHKAVEDSDHDLDKINTLQQTKDVMRTAFEAHQREVGLIKGELTPEMKEKLERDALEFFTAYRTEVDEVVDLFKNHNAPVAMKRIYDLALDHALDRRYATLYETDIHANLEKDPDYLIGMAKAHKKFVPKETRNHGIVAKNLKKAFRKTLDERVQEPSA